MFPTRAESPLKARTLNTLTKKKSDVKEAVQQTIPYLHLRFKNLFKEMVDFILKRKPPLKLPPCAC